MKKDNNMRTNGELEDQKTPSGEEMHDPKEKKKKKADPKDAAIKELQEKIGELNDKYLRLYSEFDNYRKRTQKERIEFSKNASEEIIVSLLTVLDDMERALKSAVVSENQLEVVTADGIRLIYNKFNGILAQKGLEPIPALGETFNVDYHDALTNIPATTDDMKGKVVDEIEKGYQLNGKVIRYSKVVVGI